MPIPISNTKVLVCITQYQAFCNTLVLDLVLEACGWDRVRGVPGGCLVEMDGLDGLFNPRKVVRGREPTDSDF